MSKSQDWKEKYEKLALLLKSKEQALADYQKAIQQSNLLMKEVMDKLSIELKMAHQIHRILLPVDLPVVPNFEFSFKFRSADKQGVGKDFYEVFPHSTSKSFSIIMSSCASHSLSALLFSARLKMMTQAKTKGPWMPDEFINRLVEEMSWDISDLSEEDVSHPLHQKIDLFYALVNQKTYEMSYCLVGNITALLQYVKTGEVEKLKSSPAGLEKINKLNTHVVSLNSRDRLILCSPGILQCRNPGGDTYSFSALKKSLQSEKTSSVHQVRNRIIYELKSFAQGQPSENDQSVLVMEVKNYILKLAKK